MISIRVRSNCSCCDISFVSVCVVSKVERKRVCSSCNEFIFSVSAFICFSFSATKDANPALASTNEEIDERRRMISTSTACTFLEILSLLLINSSSVRRIRAGMEVETKHTKARSRNDSQSNEKRKQTYVLVSFCALAMVQAAFSSLQNNIGSHDNEAQTNGLQTLFLVACSFRCCCCRMDLYSIKFRAVRI